MGGQVAAALGGCIIVEGVPLIDESQFHDEGRHFLIGHKGSASAGGVANRADIDDGQGSGRAFPVGEGAMDARGEIGRIEVAAGDEHHVVGAIPAPGKRGELVEPSDLNFGRRAGNDALGNERVRVEEVEPILMQRGSVGPACLVFGYENVFLSFELLARKPYFRGPFAQHGQTKVEFGGIGRR